MEKKDTRDLPVGFMDSGLGGISVLKEAVRLMPYEDFIYYGDSLHSPYGTKETEQIRRLTFAVVEKQMAQGIKGLVVACNTATGAAVRALRQAYPQLPLVGIEPAIKPAAEQSRGGQILVMATPMTIQQEKFRMLLKRYETQAQIIPVPCAGLMEFVEKGELDGAFLDRYFAEHLEPYLTKQTETIVLGCTHYPFLRPHLRKFLKNSEIQIIDGSLGTSRELKRRLAEAGLLRNEETDGRPGKIVFENSRNTQEMIDRSWRLLQMAIE